VPRNRAGARHCAFLDFDGTLVPFAPRPDGVRREPRLIALLATLRERLGGAVAIVSGRPIATLDALLAPLQLPAAGLHGLERRDAQGRRHGPDAPPAWMAAARRAVAGYARGNRGLRVEDKQHALAVHHRGAPPRVAVVLRQFLLQLRDAASSDAQVLDGDGVVELRAAGGDKAAAVAAFMAEPPYVGRTPVYIGDDVTDAPALAAVAALGGIAIGVADRIDAPWQLPDPAAVRAWLDELAATARTP